MEFSLHRQLKEVYSEPASQQEVRLGRYRIDVCTEHRLIEIQHGSLAAIRDKIGQLVVEYDVLVVKPIVARKRIVHHRCKGGATVRQRWSPKQGKLLDLFDELIYFTRVFPHPRLALEVAMVEVVEHRFPGRGRRRRRRKNDFQIQDVQLLRMGEVARFDQVEDLCRLLPTGLPRPFDTQQLADGLDVPRWSAQRIAYCLRKMAGLRVIGKRRGAMLYEFASSAAGPSSEDRDQIETHRPAA